MEVNAIAHIPISTLFLLKLAKKHLFDFRYRLIRGRTFSLMNASTPLSPERRCADKASYPPFLFQARPTRSGNTCLITACTLGGSSGSQPRQCGLFVRTCRIQLLKGMHATRKLHFSQSKYAFSPLHLTFTSQAKRSRSQQAIFIV